MKGGGEAGDGRKRGEVSKGGGELGTGGRGEK